MATLTAAVMKTMPPWLEDDYLPETDGVPLDSDWQRLAMNLLIDVTTCRLRGRQDFYVGGNMFIYFKTAREKTQQLLGPDYFLVWGASFKPARRYWTVWKEGGRFPNLIMELGSPRTIKRDRTVKKEIYEKKFRTHEYFSYDPDAGPEIEKLVGWRLVKGRYRRIKPDDRGWLWCEEMELWIGPWTGSYGDRVLVYPRFYDKDGKLVPTFEEAQAQRADEEKRRADEQKQRADALEAELARLKAHPPTNNGRRKKSE